MYVVYEILYDNNTTTRRIAPFKPKDNSDFPSRERVKDHLSRVDADSVGRHIID